MAKSKFITLPKSCDLKQMIHSSEYGKTFTPGYFRAGAYVIKRKAWWQNAKVKAVGASALVIVLFLLIIIIIESNES